MATGHDLIEAALGIVGRLSSGESATTQERADYVLEFNRMLGSWNVELGPIFFETLDSLTWTSGNASRTIGVSGDFNVARPQQIISAFYRSGTTDFPIQIITHQEYQEIPDKATTGNTPIYLAYNPTFASSLGTLFMYPTPSESITLRLNSRKPIADITGAGTVTLPPGYEDAIVYNLARRLASRNGARLTPEDMQMAIRLKQNLIESNIQFQPPKMNPLAPGQQSTYNPLQFINR